MANLYRLPRVTVSSLGYKNLTTEVKSIPYLECLENFHLDLRIPRYSNYPQLSCLGMNPGRGWNPDLEESYLLENREYEAETWNKESTVYSISGKSL